MSKLQNKKFFSLILFILIVLLVEWAGHQLTFTSVDDWYPTLHKPAWTPPSWVFSPIWTILYLTIAVSGWLVFCKVSSSRRKKAAFWIYGVQLFCNLIWSYFFFFLKNPGLALLDVLLLVTLILMNIVVFAKIYLPAAVLLMPYFLWTIYATILNAAIWSLNR